ncbi:MAG: hypothetical protein JHC52_08040 [Chthoniobacterales bacterium]|jgi:hypothetical protein|nr:hypothetical protein [Chthoniobacterales bacterium]
MIGNGAAWAEPGRTMVVKRGGTGVQQPVPIFRQAGVLATVRGALAGSSAQPRAEFRHGVLTLTFDHGTNDEISAAVKKTLAVAGSSSVRVALQH